MTLELNWSPNGRGPSNPCEPSIPPSGAASAVEFLRQNVAPDRKGVGLKYIFGSDFPYRNTGSLGTLTCDNADTRPSLGKGGFSNVWGASILPYLQRDIDRWPITIDQLAPHYRAVLGRMDISATNDELARTFPLYTDRSTPLRGSRQAEALWRTFDATSRGLTQPELSLAHRGSLSGPKRRGTPPAASIAAFACMGVRTI